MASLFLAAGWTDISNKNQTVVVLLNIQVLTKDFTDLYWKLPWIFLKAVDSLVIMILHNYYTIFCLQQYIYLHHLFDLWKTFFFLQKMTKFRSACLNHTYIQTCTSLHTQTKRPNINKWTVVHCVGWFVPWMRGLCRPTQLQSGSYQSVVVLWRAQLIFQGHTGTHQALGQTPELSRPSLSGLLLLKLSQ